MKALCWHGKHDVRIDEVPEPQIINDHDAIVKVTATAICGTDLHLYNGIMPYMHAGDILGHEFMGEVVAVGNSVSKLKLGDRVVVPAVIACGCCYFCKRNLFSLCEKSNPNAELARKQLGQATASIFGTSHLLGGVAGGQAEYVRVPYADVGPIIVPDDILDEQVLFLSDILPTGYMAASNCDIEEGDTVAVWGCGPVGQFAIQCAWLLGAERVIAIDCIPERLKMAETLGHAETINFQQDNVYDRLLTMTKGRGSDRCIDAVGAESHTGPTIDSVVDKAKQIMLLETDRPHCLREAMMCCRNGGTISIAGTYIGYLDNLPFGSAMNRGLTLKMGQTPIQRYVKPLLDNILKGKINPSQIITHHFDLDELPYAYRLFNNKDDECIKVVIKL